MPWRFPGPKLNAEPVVSDPQALLLRGGHTFHRDQKLHGFIYKNSEPLDRDAVLLGTESWDLSWSHVIPEELRLNLSQFAFRISAVHEVLLITVDI